MLHPSAGISFYSGFPFDFRRQRHRGFISAYPAQASDKWARQKGPSKNCGVADAASYSTGRQAPALCVILTTGDLTNDRTAWRCSDRKTKIEKSGCEGSELLQRHGTKRWRATKPVGFSQSCVKSRNLPLFGM